MKPKPKKVISDQLGTSYERCWLAQQGYQTLAKCTGDGIAANPTAGAPRRFVFDQGVRIKRPTTEETESISNAQPLYTQRHNGASIRNIVASVLGHHGPRSSLKRNRADRFCSGRHARTSLTLLVAANAAAYVAVA